MIYLCRDFLFEIYTEIRTSA